MRVLAVKPCRAAAAALGLLASAAASAQLIGLWPPSARPAIADAGADKPVEVGVRISADVPGQIVGIRFFKAKANTGKHLVHLWTSVGTRLAEASPRAETPAGWQQADFARPVAIEPGKIYLASYHSPAGHLSVDHGAFAGKSPGAPLLHALADEPAAPNGVFSYGPAGTFPTQSFHSTNYWVDVVFRPAMAPANALLALEVSPRYAAVGASGAVQLAARGRYGDGSWRDVTSLVQWGSGDDAAFTVSPSGLAKRAGPGATTASAKLGAAAGAASLVGVSPAENPPLPSGGATGKLGIAAGALPDGMLGLEYAAPLAAAGGIGPYRWSAEGVLPAGLRLDGPSGVISGRPAVAGSFEVRAAVADAGGGSAARTLRLAIGPASYSVWPRELAVTADDTTPEGCTEAGVRFRSDVAGYLVAIRFYRRQGDPGSRAVHLWSREGNLLAEAKPDARAESGWQEVPLPGPIAIEAGVSYVASRRIDGGRIAMTNGYFEEGVNNPPLHIDVGTPARVGGVFAFGRGVTFPEEGVRAANPWVDVVFVPAAVPPALASVQVTAREQQGELGEPRQWKAIGVDTRGGEWDLTRLARWDSADPAAAASEGAGLVTPLRAGEARVRASFRGVTGVATLITPDRAPLPDEGPGGPILIVAGAQSLFGRYLAEILRAEGLNEFLLTDLSRVDAALLARHDVVVLGDVALTGAQAATINQWVMGGGSLVAMRPDRKLAPLLGLRDTGGALADAYLKVDGNSSPGRGITARTMQFHGAADLYRLEGATAIADLYRTAAQPAGHPAVTLRKAGRGQSAAFTFDLARSVVYTRQGNPAWSRQSRSGVRPRRSHDLFFGRAAEDPQPDWVDFTLIDLPQADEQQRLFANLILSMSRKPLPRFWYLPSGHRAVVVMTGDDHGRLAPALRFEKYLALSRPDCSALDWECVRSTAYVDANSLLSAEEAQRFEALGFEIALHVTTDCADFESRAALDAGYEHQLTGFAAKYPALSRPATSRTHCLAWSDFDTQPKVELANGIRLDTNYYYWPDSWVKNRPGLMTGSAMPMRFADRTGRIIDVFQVATQLTDESGQTYPSTVEALLRNALGPAGYFGVLTANMHTDHANSPGSDAILAAARAGGVPVISARQLLHWLDARNASSFESLRWESGVLGFAVRAAPGARNLQALLPMLAGAEELSTLVRGQEPVQFTKQTIKGIDYAVFRAVGGEYRAGYGGR